MKQIIKIAILLAFVSLSCQVARATFLTNDMYLGFTEDSAQSDYDIDLGQPSVIGIGGTSVVDLSSHFSLATFNSVFTGGANGVVMAVVAGDNKAGQFDVFATQVRVGGPGNPAVAGSSITATHSSSQMSGGAGQVAAILSSTDNGLPPAGSSLVDSTKSYTSVVDTLGVANNFIGKTGVIPFGTFDSSSILYLDLYEASVALPYTYQGYFTMDLSSGTPKLTFTPAGVVGSGPTANFSGGPTNGFAPLSVVFTNTSTGSITNWAWNFGDGHLVTNITSANVTHIYTNAGTYTVSLTVTAAGVPNTKTLTGYVVVYSIPRIGGLAVSSGKLILSGSNGPPGMQYRILTTTNLATPILSWKPVLTNNFLSDGTYGYTNSTTNAMSFFRLVSP